MGKKRSKKLKELNGMDESPNAAAREIRSSGISALHRLA
jgi:hypothetical protein